MHNPVPSGAGHTCKPPEDDDVLLNAPKRACDFAVDAVRRWFGDFQPTGRPPRPFTYREAQVAEAQERVKLELVDGQ